MARPRSFDEEAVLDQVIQLFWERGYEETSLAELEARLGLGRQSLYNAFGDKHALFLRALDHYRLGTAKEALAPLNAQGAGLKAIRAFFHWSVGSLTAAEPRRGCLLTNTISERASQDPDALLRCNQSRDALERGFRRALMQAKERGEVSKSLDVDACATLLVVQTYGLNVLAKTGATAGELRAAVEALLAGLG